MKRAAGFGALALWALCWLGALPAFAAVVVHDRCTGTDHFPEQPVGNAPSKQAFALALDPTFAGKRASISISGASGNQTGSGIVGDDGRVQIDVPLQQYGTHQVIAAGVGDQPIAPNDVVPNGTFTVSSSEQPCSPSQLRTAPAAAAPTTTTTTAARATTTAPVVSTVPSATNAEPTSSSSDRPIVVPMLIAGGTVLIVVGGTMVARSGRGSSVPTGLDFAPSIPVDDKGNAVPIPDGPPEEPDDGPLGFQRSQGVGVDADGRIDRTPTTVPEPSTDDGDDRTILDDIEDSHEYDGRPREQRGHSRWQVEARHAPLDPVTRSGEPRVPQTPEPPKPEPPKPDPPKPPKT